MNMLNRLGAATLAALLCTGAAQAERLTLAIGSEVTSLDPHFFNNTTNNAFAAAIFETLVARDDRGKLTSGLATEWTAVGDTVWEFKLRPDVVFHNGNTLTAEDVAFTVARIPQVVNSPGSFQTYLASVERVEVVDPLTLRIHTKGPDPLLPVALSTISILDAQTHEGKTTQDFDSGGAVIGTGPYRYASHRPGDVVELTRNDSYWGDAPAWSEVSYRMIPNEAARVAALLSGGVDFIDQPPTSDIEMLRGRDDLALSEVDSLRIFYLLFDMTGKAAHVTDNAGASLAGPQSPLLDARVRRALSLAIDRKAIVARVMEGNAAAAGQPVPAGASGHVADIAVPELDIDAAKALLAEAGYPEGFRLSLHGSNDRYPNDSQILQAVGQMWSRAGVRTQVVVAPFTSYIAAASKQEYSALQGSFGSSTADPIAGLRTVFATYDKERGFGSANRGRYSNPDLDKLLIEAMHEMDETRRAQLVERMMHITVEDTAIIPLHHQRAIWVMRKGMTHVPRMDEQTRPQDVRPAG